jgi:hypothetical protein
MHVAGAACGVADAALPRVNAASYAKKMEE